MIKKTIKRIYCFTKNHKKKCKIKKNANISISTILEGNNVIGTNVMLDTCEIGLATYIGPNSKFYKTKIGKFTSIGENVKGIYGQHPTKKWISTHPAFYSTKKQAGFTFVGEDRFNEEKLLEGRRNTIEIGNDVWIGENVIILSGVKIGDGCIIGAGAVVSKDIQDYSIVAGNPAKLIRYRFTQEKINRLKKIQWWNKDLEWIKKNSAFFSDEKIFIEKMEKIL